MEGTHLRHINDEEFSPLLLAACITGHDYRDAFKILREQGCSLINKKFYYDDTHKISTGLESVNQQKLTLMAYVSIGEYLAKTGGDEGIQQHLNDIFYQVVELKNREYANM
ncbi:hypothetical protein WH06_24315 [Aeromonas salmonicida subsp. salmonicida]|uniref:Uncharacterized protein n=3 Tax=Aeromonas TaxID=642 RepID=A0A2N3IN80_AERSO|nr:MULTISPECIES: hypothetical protein [Aeromonas]EHI50108.1 hypothetical protein IYQ_23455 [Aeromonas salmonicida subsp. salmonicida 01-B526]EKP0254352.1 hypothetical protein [Aeromonas salmonicida]EKP0267159.1 hypothetical protein [Aeromonas salmonicida]EKP0271401.1 hypothetical protein [Aeromonas salmonicida]EKP0289021.1 hypothetical protein [Aeromonas salmonicida]